MIFNSEVETHLALQVVAELVGEENADGDMAMLTGSEDFTCLLQARHGCLMRIGNGEAQANKMLHNPSYDFNDNNIVTDAAYWSRLVKRHLPPPRVLILVATRPALADYAALMPVAEHIVSCYLTNQ